MRGPPIAIVGPTASGKTALSIEVARRLDGEIIVMDSRQIYREMEIGTAKPDAEERSRIPHHGLDIVDPSQRFSAGKFADYARRLVAAIEHRGRLPLLVGGTGFFLRALTHPIFREPPLDRERRRDLADFLGGLDDETMLRWLRELDPESAERLRSWGGRQRRMRALEMPLLTGRTLPWWHRHSPSEEAPLRPLTFVLQLDRDVLDGRIDRRIEAMVELGLVEEVRRLLRSGYHADSPGMRSVGYAELIPHIEGETTLDEALEEVRKNTRAYAKRQSTWFRQKLPAGAVELDATESVAALTQRVVTEWERRQDFPV